jgi:predicted DNA-binding transcriptional regulator AlpA
MTQAAYTVPQFCEAHGGISVPFFYTLINRGKAPRMMRVGKRVLISHEAATEWRREMEADYQAAPQALAS